MEVGIIVLLVLFITFQFTFMNMNLQKNSNMKTEVFEALRASNQNALIEVQDKYDEYDKITSSEMLENWLINYCNNNNMDFENVEITFSVLETEPVPVYLACIKAEKETYFLIDKKSVVEYYNGAMILPDEEEGD